MISTGPGFDLGNGHRGVRLDFQLALRLHAEHELLDGGVLLSNFCQMKPSGLASVI